MKLSDHRQSDIVGFQHFDLGLHCRGVDLRFADNGLLWLLQQLDFVGIDDHRAARSEFRRRQYKVEDRQSHAAGHDDGDDRQLAPDDAERVLERVKQRRGDFLRILAGMGSALIYLQHLVQLAVGLIERSDFLT